MSEDKTISEREKWQAELALKERELRLKEAELRARLDDQKQADKPSPLMIAIVGGIIAILTNIVANYFSSNSQTDLEKIKFLSQLNLDKQKAESQRILEVVKTGDPDKAAINLKFLTDIHLI